MRLHRYLVRPLSPWGTPLRGDTLYGLLLWRIAERNGDVACRDAIEAFRAGKPPFVLSSLMPEGKVRAPLLPPMSRARFQQLVKEGVFRDTSGKTLSLDEALKAYKFFRKRGYLPLDVWQAHAPALSLRELFVWHCAQPQEKMEHLATADVEPHVTIDRRTGGALEGGLFFNRLTYYDERVCFHLYARTEHPEILLELLRLVGELGFGKDASTGKGRFSVEEDRAFNPDSLEILGTASLLLSPCASLNMSAIDGWYGMEVKRGKTGPGTSSPFKNPVLLVQEGSVLRTLPQGPYLLDHIHQDEGIVQVTYPLTLPCRVIEEVQQP